MQKMDGQSERNDTCWVARSTRDCFIGRIGEGWSGSPAQLWKSRKKQVKTS